MGIIAIDLGTTNIKVAVYTNKLDALALESHNVAYMRENTVVEFDPNQYFDLIVALINACWEKTKLRLDSGPVQLVLTGQAESLIVTDNFGRPLRNGISWLDMRSQMECEELSRQFDKELCYRITGQPEITPTWPITKILWMKHNEPETFCKAGKYLLLKDYILYRLTGEFVGEYSIYPFSHYFDITEKRYWEEPLSYCGIGPEQLPGLVEPCSVVGEIQPDILSRVNLPKGSYVNAGTLDHFAGMIGTGNIREGMVSESAGTVSSIATFIASPFASSARIPVYCGPFQNSYIYLPVCESGGVSLEWYRNNFLPNDSFQSIDEICQSRSPDDRLTFLPYLTGVNPPEFDSNARGVFYGATMSHDAHDFALAIMYGVASLLRKNIDCFKKSGIPVKKIITTGGGAKSALWSQIKADICKLPVEVPDNKEAPCLGAAIIGAVENGSFSGYEAAIDAAVHLNAVFYPNPEHSVYERKHQLFCDLYSALTPVFALNC